MPQVECKKTQLIFNYLRYKALYITKLNRGEIYHTRKNYPRCRGFAIRDTKNKKLSWNAIPLNLK